MQKKIKKIIDVWGSGKPRREFLHSICAANVIIDLIEISEARIAKYTKGDFSHINIGSGIDYKISDIVKKLIKISKFKGKIIYNKRFLMSKRKLLNIELLKKISPKSYLRIKKMLKILM